MNSTSAPLDHGVSEFDVAGLTPVPSRHVRAPRVCESRAAMEYKVSEVVRIRYASGEPAEGWLVLGEVVAVYIDKSLIKDGVYQTALANPILRAGRGGDYVEVTENRGARRAAVIRTSTARKPIRSLATRALCL